MTADDADQLPTARLNAGETWVRNHRTGRRRRLKIGDHLRDGEGISTPAMLMDHARGGTPMQTNDITKLRARCAAIVNDGVDRSRMTPEGLRRDAVRTVLGDVVEGKTDDYIQGAFNTLFPETPIHKDAVQDATTGLAAALRDAQPGVVNKTIADAGIAAALRDVGRQHVTDSDAARIAMMDDERIRKGLPKFRDHTNPAEAAAAEGELAAIRSLYEENMHRRCKGLPPLQVTGLADREVLDPRGDYCRRMSNAWKTAGARG
ncbi:MAG: hypothetical protein ACRYG8_43070 [Janthinobacterium lividum]